MPLRISVVSVVLLLLVVAAAGGAAGCRKSTTTPGQALYEQYCAVCHGAGGHSVTGMTSTPQLDSQGMLIVADDAFLTASIARGRPGANSRGKPGTKMATFGADYGGPLANAQIAEILKYVRHWQTQPSVALTPYRTTGNVEAGRQVYEVCVPCHQVDGWSTAAPCLAGETLQTAASDAFFKYTPLHGRPGTTMPAFQLDEEQANDLVAYVRSLYQPAGQATPTSVPNRNSSP
jgi:mono/diheme cytochrome c family protein